MNSSSRIPAGRYVPIVLIKLVVHPLLVGAVGLGAIALGLPLERFTLTVLAFFSFSAAVSWLVSRESGIFATESIAACARQYGARGLFNAEKAFAG